MPPKSYPQGSAPWETGNKPQSFPVGQAPWETQATPTAQPKQSLSQRIFSDLAERRKTVSEKILPAQGQSQGRVETAFQTVGQGAGFAGDIGMEVAKSVGSSLYNAVGGDNSPLGTLLRDTKNSKFVQAGLQTLGKGIGAYDAWKQEDPRHAAIGRDIESIINIGALVPAAKGVESVAGGVIKAGKSMAESVAKKSAIKSFDDVVEYTAPKLTPTEEAAAKAAGRAKTEGILKKTVIEPSKRELEVAKFAEEAGVDSSKTFDENIRLMRDAQKSSAKSLRAGLKESKAIWNQNEVKGTLSGIEKPLTIKSDAALNKLADNFQTAVIKIAEKQEKRAIGLLDLRQELDELIDLEFPSNIYTKDTPMGQYIRKVRQSLNDLAESKLPDGNLPDGKSFKGELRRQSMLYDAIDNVAAKAPKLGESALPRLARVKAFAKKHPWITAGVAALGGERILKKIGVPIP